MKKNNDGMPNPATEAKKRWNAKNYTQVKVHVDPEIASAFKAACAASEVSMAGVLAQFMVEYSKSAKKRKPAPDYSTRRQRRAAVKIFTQQLEMVRAAEEQCRDNTPENLQSSVVYETADEYVSQLDEVIGLMDAIY
jgi:hypothetical protein